MPGIDINQLWNPGRALPSAQPDQKSPVGGIRGGRYAEQFVLNLMPTKHLLADEGTYFVATNPTPGTALLTSLTGSTTFSDTVPFIYLQNNDSKSNPIAKRLYFDYLKIIITTAPTSTTTTHFAIKVDPILRTFSTNNTVAITPQCPNSDLSPSAVTSVNVQNSATASAYTGASSSSARVLASTNMGGLPIVGDEFVIISGTTGAGAYNGLTAAQAVCAGRKVTCVPPIIVGPGSCMSIYSWVPGNASTPFSYEFEMGWWER